MRTWQADQLQSVLTSQSAEDLFAKLAKLARNLGFEYCAFGMRFPLPVSNPRLLAVSNYPKAWQKHYVDHRYLGIDPILRHARQSVLPLVWTERLFNIETEFWEEAHSYGVSYGWTKACSDRNGVSTMLTLARSAEPLCDDELEQKSHMLEWLSQIGHVGMSEALLPKVVPEMLVRLSEREIEALRWTAEGKTAAEIATIMCIAERTVNFHLNNAVAKLGATNKTAATVRAALLGMLH